MRKAGVLLPIASLPSKFGMGDFGPTSYEFVDYVKEAGFKIWQILPLNPLGYGNSPYQPYSSKAMDELYVSLEMLKKDGLIKKLKTKNPKATKVDYEAIRAFKQPYLREAFENFVEDEAYNEFISQSWVYEYAVFLAFKKANGMKCWNEWPKKDIAWMLEKYELNEEMQIEVKFNMFVQYILYTQWKQLRSYANEKGIELMGDIPFYVGIDSLDVWANQDEFLLDGEYRPSYVAGVPPDYFSKTGQRWGNPIYDWDKMEKNKFRFWLDRLAYCSKMFDIIRIDHFRAFDTYWKIPASCPTAVEGEWIEAPGYALFDTIYDTYPNINIVAEDLGELRPEVLELRDHYNLAGMRIIQFSFDPYNKMEDKENLLVYTGTHDNESLKGWYSRKDSEFKKKTRQFLKKNKYNYKNVQDNLLMYTLDTKARLAILPMLDILAKNDNCRLNTPGTVGNPNWQWKLKDFEEFKDKIPMLKEMIEKAKR